MTSSSPEAPPALGWRAVARFTALGIALFLGREAWSVWRPPAPEVSRRIEISPAELEALLRRAALPAGAGNQVLARMLLEEAVDEEILYREALQRGFDRDDPVVQQRLVRLMLDLGARPGATDAELYEEARALGLEREDLVVRRRLVQRMRMSIESGARAGEVGEAVLRAHFERHRDELRQPERVRLTQVFFDRGRRGAAAQPDAEAALATLRAGSPAGGDPFPLSHAEGPSARDELARAFGEEFAGAAFALPAGEWAGPLASSYGLHLVRVEERVPAADPPFEAVRDRVRRAVLDARAQAAVRATIAGWRANYEVVLPRSIDRASPSSTPAERRSAALRRRATGRNGDGMKMAEMQPASPLQHALGENDLCRTPLARLSTASAFIGVHPRLLDSVASMLTALRRGATRRGRP